MSKAEGRVPFFTDTLGFEELFSMYKMVKSKINLNPTVISAEDLLKNPRLATKHNYVVTQIM